MVFATLTTFNVKKFCCLSTGCIYVYCVVCRRKNWNQRIFTAESESVLWSVRFGS